MKLVIIESPYKGDVPRNKLYLQSCIRDCIFRGESPYASHRMLTDALDDNNPLEREIGIRAGLAWRNAFTLASRDDAPHQVFHRVTPVFYLDLGWSNGMERARTLYVLEDVPYEERKLPADDPFFVKLERCPSEYGGVCSPFDAVQCALSAGHIGNHVFDWAQYDKERAAVAEPLR